MFCGLVLGKPPAGLLVQLSILCTSMVQSPLWLWCASSSSSCHTSSTAPSTRRTWRLNPALRNVILTTPPVELSYNLALILRPNLPTMLFCLDWLHSGGYLKDSERFHPLNYGVWQRSSQLFMASGYLSSFYWTQINAVCYNRDSPRSFPKPNSVGHVCDENDKCKIWKIDMEIYSQKKLLKVYTHIYINMCKREREMISVL